MMFVFYYKISEYVLRNLEIIIRIIIKNDELKKKYCMNPFNDTQYFNRMKVCK